MVEENRRAPRIDCRGVAGVQKLPVVGSPVSGKIENLSEGGCLIELDMPVSLVVDEIVELSFRVNELPFRALAKARALRSDKLIGFQFWDLTERSKMRLRDLIEELRPSFKWAFVTSAEQEAELSE